MRKGGRRKDTGLVRNQLRDSRGSVPGCSVPTHTRGHGDTVKNQLKCELLKDGAAVGGKVPPLDPHGAAESQAFPAGRS